MREKRDGNAVCRKPHLATVNSPKVRWSHSSHEERTMEDNVKQTGVGVLLQRESSLSSEAAAEAWNNHDTVA